MNSEIHPLFKFTSIQTHKPEESLELKQKDLQKTYKNKPTLFRQCSGLSINVPGKNEKRKLQTSKNSDN